MKKKKTFDAGVDEDEDEKEKSMTMTNIKSREKSYKNKLTFNCRILLFDANRGMGDDE